MSFMLETEKNNTQTKPKKPTPVRIFPQISGVLKESERGVNHKRMSYMSLKVRNSQVDLR